RARHPWLTGSAGWMYFTVTHWILGVRPGYNGLTIDPCIPAGWKGFSVTRRWREATYRIDVTNPQGVQKGVKSIHMNGNLIKQPISPQPPGSINQIIVEMGSSDIQLP
ncbi:MAG TPA: glycosyl hydrolase family 65 protein, partial [Anaerolineales bacterium]